jgi:protease IV
MFARYRSILCLLFLGLCISVTGNPSLAATADTQPAGKPIVAVFDFSQGINEQANEGFSLTAPPPTLREVVERMKKAATDPAVKAVVVLADNGGFGVAQLEEVRAAMREIRRAGKPIFAHADSVTMGQYVLLCGASRLSVSPTGDVWVTGVYASTPYLHGLLEKIGVQPDFLHCGAYKSASEIFMRDGPSPEAEQMENWLLDSLYDTAIQLIASGRQVKPNQARGWIDQGPYTAEKAKAAGMIDAVEVRADLEAMLKKTFGDDVVFEKKYGAPKAPKLDFSNPFGLFASFANMMAGENEGGTGKDAVGIVYVNGMIIEGKADDTGLGSEVAASTDVAKALDQAAGDDSIKAVVLRIDSPGGSATASEIILQATLRLKGKKPLVVSMGNVAGSGGYYVACGAETIFADEATLTGSIGVVGGKLATTEMWKNLGVTWKSYQRGTNAGLLSTDSVFTDAQRQRMQAWMDDIYGVFKGHVTAIRGNRLKKPIDALAGGRVYTGEQALGLGLVDKIGTLQDATEYIAGEAKLTDYDVRVVPKSKSFLEKLIEQSNDEESDPEHLDSAMGSLGGSFGSANPSLVKLAEPYLRAIDPVHGKMIKAALAELQLVQDEGVVLVMPGVSPAQFGQ